MKKYQQYITPVLLLLLLAAWAGRSHIRNWFPPKMKFANTVLTVIDDQQPITINHYKGNVVIVSCFQTWCIDCVRETPVLNQLYADVNAPAFKIIYVTDEDSVRINSFRNRFSSGNILFTHSTASMKALGITAFPTTFLLDKNGAVVLTKLEGYNWVQEEARIKKLIAE